MPKQVNASNDEPEQSEFKLPSEKEHLFQISDWELDKNDKNIVVTKCEIVSGEEKGLSLLHRVNMDDSVKGFYYTRLFLKAIGEPYKGQFEINENNFQGKQFYATPKHSKSKDGTKTYANIDKFNFDKLIEQKFDLKPKTNNTDEIEWDADIK